jgi:hypothetical protein
LDYPRVLQAVPAVLVHLGDANEVVAQAVAAAEAGFIGRDFGIIKKYFRSVFLQTKRRESA